jgi:hypothetical protein
MSADDIYHALHTALGVQKNSIRLRKHSVTWKPHVVLRRVELADDEDAPADGTPRAPRVYFSLFAAKSINVKPGKEILFAIPGATGADDDALVFAGVPADPADADSGATDTEKTDVDENEASESADVMASVSHHPKLRKAWTRRTIDDEAVKGAYASFAFWMLLGTRTLMDLHLSLPAVRHRRS